MANIPFSADPDIVALMNRLLDEAAERRRRHQNYAGALTPIRGSERERPASTNPLLSKAA